MYYSLSKFLVPFLMIFFPLFSFAQMGSQIPTQIKPQALGKTYWCAEVQDILFPKEPQQGQKFSVGVRVKFTKKTIVPGVPGQKLCSCAFEGPPSAPVKFWSKTMSLRLIGIKYSETDTNLLEYYGQTPAFPPYDYGGFPVIGFRVTENDLKRGYIDVWGWASKEPLQCRGFDIYVSLAVYPDEGHYDKAHECHFQGDFKKSFKPKCLQVPKIPEERIKKGSILRIPPEKFLIERLPPIKFVPFDRAYFKIPPEQKTITLKEKVITFHGKPVIFRKAKTIDVEKFLKEVNEIEKGLNEMGYTLRDDKPIKIKYKYPREQFRLQKEMLSKDFLKRATIPLPSQTTCEGYSEGYEPSLGAPKDFVPLDWGKRWDASFGNDDFGVTLGAGIEIYGNRDSSNINPNFGLQIALLGENVDILNIKQENNELVGRLLGNKVFSLPLDTEVNKELFDEDFDWSIPIEFPVGPINVTGRFGFEGHTKATFNGLLSASEGVANGNITSNLNAKAYGELGPSYEIVELGVEANLTIIDDTATLDGKLGLQGTQKNFGLSAKATNRATLLSGSLYVYGEIDYWLDSKKFEIEFYNFDGFESDETLFSYNTSVPAEKDHQVWLKILNISGITPYTARNEKLDIEPVGYDLTVNIDGRTYTKTLKDYNKDGIYGNALGEYEDQVFEIPLLSYKKVPISIEVVEKYKIGTLEFKNTLDFAPGVWKKVELCYDPGKRTFSGTKSGKEDEEITSVGDTSYWGERNHGIRFKLSTEGLFKAAPAKAK